MAASAKKKHASVSDFPRLLAFCDNKVVGIAITLAAMALLAFVVNMFNVPNPNMILVAGLVICTSAFGYTGGIVSAVVMMTYTLWFFSTGNDFVTFTDQNVQKVIVTAIGVLVICFFVSILRVIIASTLRELRHANEMLEEDNKLLEAATTKDALTKTQNRFGLRRDFPDYLGDTVHVMMLDIDNFKTLNDTYGHQVGDFILAEVGRFLADIHGPDHVYRYGGDEFLAICPRVDKVEFDERCDHLRQSVAGIEVANGAGPVQFSAGYTYGTPSIQSDLRLMIRQADACLYESKNAGKGQIRGEKFSRAKARSAENRMAGAVNREGAA